MSQTETPKFRDGDIVHCKSDDGKGTTCLCLGAVSVTSNKYNLERVGGGRLTSVSTKISKATQEQKTDWINKRIGQLSDADKVGELARKCSNTIPGSNPIPLADLFVILRRGTDLTEDQKQNFEKALTQALNKGDKIVRGSEPDTVGILNDEEQEKLKQSAAQEKEAEAKQQRQAEKEKVRQEQIAAARAKIDDLQGQLNKLNPRADQSKEAEGNALGNAQVKLQAAEVQQEMANVALELAKLLSDGTETTKAKELTSAKAFRTKARNAVRLLADERTPGQPDSTTIEADIVGEQKAFFDGNFSSGTALSELNETVVAEPVGTEELIEIKKPALASPPLIEVEEEPTPKEIAEEVTAKWEKLGDMPMEAERAELAGKMQTFWDAPKKPDAIKVVIEFIELYETGQEKTQPVFWVLFSSDNALMQRELITRIDLGTLINYVEWLIQRPSHSKSQIEGILNGLTGKFQAATREGEINHYQRIAQAMGDLLKGLDPETRGPYEWRLFSFLREGWARLAPHAQAGNNDLIGAQNHLTWVLDRKPLWPETIWDALLSSLMRDEAISRLEAGVRRRVLECAATHALAAPKGQRLTRLLHFQEALTEQMLIEFMIEIGKEATR